RTLRYRHLLVRQMVQMKNRMSGLLMETGVSYNKQRLHKVGYFRELLSTNEDVHESIRPLLKLSRDTVVRLQKTEYALVSSLRRDPLLADRVKRLRTVPGVGPIKAERECQSSDSGRSSKDGCVSARRRSGRTGLRAHRTLPESGGLETSAWGRTKDQQRAGCQVLPFAD
ncbi:MAG: hypothetical protein WBV55_04865, partial [Candidatus Sulfotelmatobacter sp.]